MNKLLTTGKCAKMSGLSQQMIIRLIDSGDLEGFVIPGSTHRRVPTDVFLKWLKKKKIPLQETPRVGKN